MWYDYIKRIITANDRISLMRQLNQKVNPEILAAKQKYINAVKRLDPSNQEQLELITKAWEDYTDALKKYPQLHDHKFDEYSSWRANKPNELIEQLYEEHKPKELLKEFESSGGTDFDSFKNSRLEEKALEMYNSEKDVSKMQEEFGVNSEETNPFKRFNDTRKQWAQQVAEYHKKDIPFVSGNSNQTVTLFIGYPGSGKSKYIEPDNTSDSPIRNTQFGLLIDPDEYQRDLMGYHSGMGSNNTLVYAVSVVKPEILKTALDRGNDIVIPMVGGTPDAILNEVVSFVTKGYKVKIASVKTDLNTSYNRSLNRAEQGGRLISPVSSGSPAEAFESTKGILSSPDVLAPDLFTKKLLNKLGITPAAQKNMSPEEKQSIRAKYSDLIEFIEV